MKRLRIRSRGNSLIRCCLSEISHFAWRADITPDLLDKCEVDLFFSEVHSYWLPVSIEEITTNEI